MDTNNTDYYCDVFGVIDYEDEQEYDGHINDLSDKQREDKYMSKDEVLDFDRDYVIKQAEAC